MLDEAVGLAMTRCEIRLYSPPFIECIEKRKGSEPMWTTIKRSLLRCLFYPVFARYVSMPGRSFSGTAPAFSATEKLVAKNLREHVDALAVGIGIRHAEVGDSLRRAAKYCSVQFIRRNFSVEMESFDFDGVSQQIVVAEIPGKRRPKEVIVIGAHYDTVPGSPGADDNASGIAALIEIATLLKDVPMDRTVRFVAFPNEEYHGEDWRNMGSYHHAKRSHDRGDNLVGMIALEMLGYFSNEPGSQKYPFPFNLFYPDRGNFIGFVGNSASRDWVRKVVRNFRELTPFPAEGAAAPERFKDIARSDHWAFWQFGCPALMVTDTSNFRYPYLHAMEDTPDKIDFDAMARITVGMAKVIVRLAQAPRVWSRRARRYAAE
jgi:hypothetical protein